MTTYISKYQKTPQGRYVTQKANAAKRGIGWAFTFDTWWKKWEESGRWEERGTRAGQYVMSRYGDEGPYAPDNTFIQMANKNTIQGNKKAYRKRHEKPAEDAFYVVNRQQIPPKEAGWYVPGWVWTDSFDLIKENA